MEYPKWYEIVVRQKNSLKEEATPKGKEASEEVKMLWTDTEDWITCEIRWYRKDWICYVKDVINKRIGDCKKQEATPKSEEQTK